MVSSEEEKKWEGSRAEIYFNQEIQELIRQKKDHLVTNYEGPTDFFQTQLQQEDVLSPEEKLQQIQDKKQEVMREEERLQQIIKEREKDQKLDELEDELRDKQDELRSVRESGVKSFSELMFEESEKRKARGHDVSDPRVAWRLKSRVERMIESRPDVEELEKEVDRLQRRVAELNGGREDWFIELDKMEVSA